MATAQSSYTISTTGYFPVLLKVTFSTYLSNTLSFFTSNQRITFYILFPSTPLQLSLIKVSTALHTLASA